MILKGSFNHELLSQHPIVNDELPNSLNRLACGTVQIKPNVRRFTNDGVVLEDGRTSFKERLYLGILFMIIVA